MTAHDVVPVNAANRFAHIDALRAFAVMLVVLAHAGLSAIIPGGSGVTIFFSISGFIITFLVLREKDKTGGFSITGFYTRRFLKIAPPLLVIVGIPTLIYALGHELDWGAVLAQFFFVFNWFEIDGVSTVLPGSGVVWSLAIEEQFYIVFALFWLFGARFRHWRLILALCAGATVISSTSVRLVFAASPLLSERIYFGTDTRLDAIAWGVLAALGYHTWLARGQKGGRLSTVLASDWMLLGAILLYLLSLLIRDDWFRDSMRFTIQSLATCAVILYGQLPGRGPVRRVFYAVSVFRPVALIGLASYSIYLVHYIVADAVRPWLAGLPAAASYLLIVALGVGAGIVSYLWLEVPLHRLYKRYAGRARPRAGKATGPQTVQSSSMPGSAAVAQPATDRAPWSRGVDPS